MFQKRRFAGILVMVLISALAVTGVATAAPNPQADTAKTGHFQDFLAKFAVNLGVDQDKVVAAFDATKKQMLDEAVQQGRLTQDQADKISARNDKPGWFGGLAGKMNDRKPGLKGVVRIGKNDMATALGITQDQLKSELQSGKKLPQIIADHGLTTEQFHQKMLDIQKEALSKAVSDGKMTQEQADRLIQKMEQHFKNPAPAAGN